MFILCITAFVIYSFSAFYNIATYLSSRTRGSEVTHARVRNAHKKRANIHRKIESTKDLRLFLSILALFNLHNKCRHTPNGPTSIDKNPRSKPRRNLKRRHLYQTSHPLSYSKLYRDTHKHAHNNSTWHTNSDRTPTRDF